MNGTPHHLNGRKLASLALIPVYLLLITIFLVLNIGTSFNPPILLLVFNSVFLGLIPLYVAYIAYKSFRASGSNGVLLKGTGMLLLGLGAIAAGIVNYLPNSLNANVTVHNTSFCVGAFLQLVGILIALSGTVPRWRPGDAPKIVILYGGIVLAFTSFVVAAVLGIVPPFFIQGSGFTELRELIISGAIFFFTMASGILLWLYYRRREEFYFWYSIGLALIGLGLLAVHFPSILGSPLGWVGRSAQYIGAVYVLIAFIALNRSAQRTGIPVEEMLSRFFGEAEAGYKALVEAATDAIIVFDQSYRIILWNTSAQKMFGYSKEEAVGQSFTQLIVRDDEIRVHTRDGKDLLFNGKDILVKTKARIVCRHRDGNTFPAEVSMSRHTVAGADLSTCIIRDVTETVGAIQELHDAALLLMQDPAPVIRVDQEGSILLANNASQSVIATWNADLNEKVPETMREQIRTSLTEGQQWDFEETVGDRNYAIQLVPIMDQHYVNLYFLDITEHRRAEEALQESRNQLESDLEAMKMLQNLSTLYIHGGDLNPVLTEIVDSAIAITGADFGNIQLLDPDTSELRIAAQNGFPDWWLDYWNIVSKGKGVCGTALGRGERVIVEDVEQSPIFAGTPALEIQLKVGVRAVQSTPLMSREGKPLGMFSTHFRTPHRPDDRQFRLLDLLARQAADIIERAVSEEALFNKNTDLNTLNQELTATQEELEQNVDDLCKNEEVLRQNEEKLKRALAEKEVLLAEIHHRVKNNLTAFISLLSLEGSTEDTPAGKTLKQDLQNRARSMALIHETLYRTHMYDEVDMGMYLTTLVDQIANSFAATRPVKTIVDAQGIMLDIPRATPAGLIINELVTNSFKYAFPESFNSPIVRNDPPTITVTLTKNEGAYKMTVKDNGIGIPPGFDIAKTKTLGLKLVNFLAKHQLQAKVEVRGDNGTEFIFRLTELEDGA